MEDDTRPQRGAAPRSEDGNALAEQLNQTTSPDAGGNVSGTREEDPRPGPGNFEIVFDAEKDEHDGH